MSLSRCRCVLYSATPQSCIYCVCVCACVRVCVCVCLQSPPYSSGSYDSVKTELSMSAEDLSSGRAQAMDDDDDDHDDHDDSDRINDAEGMDPERLKAFNVRALLLLKLLVFIPVFIG